MESFRRLAKFSVRSGVLRGAVTELHAVDEVLASASTYPRQFIDTCVISSTESGGAELRVAGQRIEHQTGMVTVLRQKSWIEEQVGRRPWHVRYLMLKGPWAAKVSKQLAALDSPAFVYDPAAPSMRRAVNEAVILALDQPPVWQWSLLARLAELCGEFERAPAPASGSPGLVERVRRLVDASPDRAWPIEQLAGALHVSSSALAHQFAAQAGVSPALWIRRRRVEVAARLLRQGLRVVQVAERMGYADAFHFSRVFKSVTGMPPSAVAASPYPSPLHPDGARPREE